MSPTEPRRPEAYTLRKSQIESQGVVYRRWLWIDIAWPSGFPVRLHRETWWDRVAKAIRFAREYQTGDVKFDRRVYIAVDQPEAAAALCDSHEERDALLRLLDRGALDLIGDAEVLRVRFRWPDGFNKEEAVPVPVTADAREWLIETIAALRSLIDHAPSQPIDVRISRIRPVIDQTGVILGATMVVSLLAWWASAQIVDPEYESRGLGRGEIISLGIAAAALLVLAARVAGRATAARLWLAAVALIVPIAAMLPFGFVPLLNDVLDTSEKHIIAAPVTDKWIHRGRRGSKSYYVGTRYWSAPHQTEGFKVATTVYDNVQPGRDCLRLTVRSGGLEFERVTDHSVSTCGRAPASSAPRAVPGPGYAAWVASAATYPKEALRAETEGIVQAEVRDRGDGRVDVRIVQSSGSYLLDDHVRDRLMESRNLMAPGSGSGWVQLPRMRFQIEHREGN